MELKFDVKNVPSVVVLTHLDQRKAEELEKTAYELWELTDAKGHESIFCLTLSQHLESDAPVQVCCPVHDLDKSTQKGRYKIEVLPRQLVLSVIHDGEYNDLKDIFTRIYRYIELNKLQTSPLHRVVFHREKREWDRTTPHKKPNMDYITEIQIQLLDH